jgi:hypothetical protein
MTSSCGTSSSRTKKGEVPEGSFKLQRQGGAPRVRRDFACNPDLQGLISFRTNGKYPSKYFAALYILIATVQPNAAILTMLPELADCCTHAAKASIIGRKTILREEDYIAYETHNAWFAL